MCVIVGMALSIVENVGAPRESILGYLGAPNSHIGKHLNNYIFVYRFTFKLDPSLLSPYGGLYILCIKKCGIARKG